jgi:hypothetical protein
MRLAYISEAIDLNVFVDVSEFCTESFNFAILF